MNVQVTQLFTPLLNMQVHLQSEESSPAHRCRRLPTLLGFLPSVLYFMLCSPNAAGAVSYSRLRDECYCRNSCRNAAHRKISRKSVYMLGNIKSYSYLYSLYGYAIG